jgi:small-conductance mechanosensitive channel
MSCFRHKASPQLVHRLLRAPRSALILAPILAAILASTLVPSRAAFAQSVPALGAATPAAPGQPALNPQEARQMLNLLNDPQKRAAFAATLETFSKATAAVAPKKAESPVPLAPNSVGAQVLAEGSGWLAGLSHQFASFGRVLGDLPTVWAFTLHTLNDQARRAEALDAAWRLALVLAAAALGEWAAYRLLRRPVRAIAAHAPHPDEPAAAAPPDPAIQAEILRREGLDMEADTGAGPETPANNSFTTNPPATNSLATDSPATDSLATNSPATEPPTSAGPAFIPPSTDADSLAEDAPALEKVDAAVEVAIRRRRFSRTVKALKRLPFVLMRFVLDLVPLGVFLGIGYAGTLFNPDLRVQAILQAAILAYAACRLATCITRMFVSPDEPCLRLVHVSDQGAEYALIWIRRIFAVGAFGFAASQIGLLFGLPQGATDAFLKAVFLLIHLFLIIIVLQCRRPVRQMIRSHRDKPSLAGTIRNRIAAIWHLVAIFYIAGLWLVWAAEIRHGYVRIWHVFLVSAGVIIAVRLFSIVVLGGLDRAFRVSPDLKSRYPGLEGRANRYYPLLRRAVSTTLVLVGALALLEAWGIDALAWFRAKALGGRLLSAVITIAIAGAIALAIWEGVNASMDRHLARLTREAQMVKSARLRTLQPMLRTVLLATLAGVFGLTALSEIGVNIAPLLAGAGILGVAIGFGSQKLVQDFITGIFLLLENAMQVGDWVTVAGLSGSVENLSIRTMRLRAGDGSVHIIPFSSVSTVTNVNRGIGNAAVSVNIPMDEDSDRVSELLGDIAAEMRAERRFADMMRSDFQLWGVDKVDNGIVTIVGQIVCTDGGRWAVQREFNRRMMIRFKDQGIRIATPVSTVYNHVLRDAPMPAQQIATAAPSNQMSESPPPAALGNSS